MSFLDRFKKKPEVVEISEVEDLELQLAQANEIMFKAEDGVANIVDGSNPRYAMHKESALKQAQRNVKVLTDKLGRAHIKNSERIIREKNTKRYEDERKMEIRCKTELRNLKGAMRDVLSDGDYEIVMNRVRVM